MADRSDSNFDLGMFGKVISYASQLKSLYGPRNAMADAMVNIYTMKWTDEENVKKKQGNVKITKSPDGRNRLLGAIRLMVASDPTFSVGKDENAPIVDEASEALEMAADVLWKRGGRVRGDPVHYDVVRSLLLWAETTIAISRTAEIVANTAGAPYAAQANAERIAKRTPILFDVWDARTCYPEYGPLGLRCFLREVETTCGAVVDEFGSAARKVYGDDYSPYSVTTLCNFWDTEYRYVYPAGSEIPIIQEKHGLAEIPIVHTLGDGSKMFSNPEDQREPFLFTTWQSGLWERQNLMLTLFYTFAFALGANPAFINVLNEQGEGVVYDASVPGGIAKVPYGGQFAPMLTKGIIDPSLRELAALADEKVSQSTIYDQTLGAPLGGNSPFSLVALLHQAGRLPLIVPQRKGSWGIGDAVRLALSWMKIEGDSIPGVIEAADIPDDFEIEATLDVALPQDEMQQAQTASSVSSGESPLVSKRYAREHYMKIGQSDKMQKEIWDEQMGTLRMQQYYNTQMQMLLQERQQIEQAMAQMQQGPQPGNAPPGAAGPGEQPPPGGEALPPQEEMAAQEQQPGLVPPVMGQNGQQPPYGMEGEQL